jgi:tetratricopeptide (TPR) repeat protein
LECIKLCKDRQKTGANVIRLNEEFIPPPKQSRPDCDSVPSLVRALKNGNRREKEAALLGLILAGAEHELTDCLAAPDPDTATLATAGLWECWLNEEGPEARAAIEVAMGLMERGNFADAEKHFISLSRRFPGWAEPINKHATILYLRGRPARSIELCELVVEMKPRHFGAWHGMALCAVKLHQWRRAIEAAREALKIQPQAKANREIILLARSKIAGC